MQAKKLKIIVREILSWLANEMKDEENKSLLEKELIDPFLKTVLHRLTPYIITSSIIFLLVILFIIFLVAWISPRIFSPGIKA